MLACGSDDLGNEKRISVSWRGLASAVDPGDVIYLADGAIRLRVQGIRDGDGELETAVEVGGAVASRQGLNIPGSTRGLPAVPEEDLDMLRFGESIGVDVVALSFVRTAQDVTDVRKHTRLPLVAKIEKPQAVDAAEEIIRAADCVMVARGDLGIELPIEEVPILQKRLLEQAGRLARPSITATQMLDSMVASTRPDAGRGRRCRQRDPRRDRRGDALPGDGDRGVPGAGDRDDGLDRRVGPSARRLTSDWNESRVNRDTRDPAYTVAYMACAAARELHLAALVVPTLSGRSARLISAHRPEVPILALSPGRETVRRCSFMWGVQAGSMRRHEVTEDADRRRRPARRRARLGQARGADRDHRRAAQRTAPARPA